MNDAVTPAQGFVFDERFVEGFFHLLDPKDSRWSAHMALGRRLRPYSFWHRLQLEYAGGPFATGGAVLMNDLEDAVAVCQSEFPYRPQPLAWRRLSRWRWNLEREVAKFKAYIGDFNTTPIIEPTESGVGAEIKQPDMDAVLVEIAAYRRHTSCAREEPWNLPMAEVYWMNAYFARAEGAQFEVITPLVEERRKRLKAKRAEMDRQAIEEMVIKEGLSIEAATAKLEEMHRTAREKMRILQSARNRLRGKS